MLKAHFSSLLPLFNFKDIMFNPVLNNVIEMAYWLVKFVGDYNALYKTIEEKNQHRNTNSPTSLISKTAATLIKFARYFLKYVDNYQKLAKATRRVAEM